MKARHLLYGPALALAFGCAPKPPPNAPVRGRVTFRGIPVRNGIIVFTPDDEAGFHGAGAQGELDADGRYALYTDGQPGAAPGRHRVTVAILDAYSGGSLPADFRDPKRSGMIADVKPGIENVLDWPLDAP